MTEQLNSKQSQAVLSGVSWEVARVTSWRADCVHLT